MTTVINLFAGPGAGKSTTAADLFALMKMRGESVELVTEYAKDLVWGENFKSLENQLYILAKQDARLNRLVGKVEYIVTDSPILLGLLYSDKDTRYGSAHFANTVRWAFKSYRNRNYFLTRRPGYDPRGRMQATREEAEELDRRLLNLLETSQVDYETVNFGEALSEQLYAKIKKEAA